MSKLRPPYLQDKLKNLAYELYNASNDLENAQSRLERLKTEFQQLENEVRFYCPTYEDEVIYIDNLVMYVSPREVSVFSIDQWEKAYQRQIAERSDDESESSPEPV